MIIEGIFLKKYFIQNAWDAVLDWVKNWLVPMFGSFRCFSIDEPVITNKISFSFFEEGTFRNTDTSPSPRHVVFSLPPNNTACPNYRYPGISCTVLGGILLSYTPKIPANIFSVQRPFWSRTFFKITNITFREFRFWVIFF